MCILIVCRPKMGRVPCLRSLLAMLKWCVKMIEDGVTDNENDEVDDEVSFVYPRG